VLPPPPKKCKAFINGYSSIELGRKAKRVHLHVLGCTLNEGAIATWRGGSQLLPSAWFLSTCVPAPCKEQCNNKKGVKNSPP